MVPGAQPKACRTNSTVAGSQATGLQTPRENPKGRRFEPGACTDGPSGWCCFCKGIVRGKGQQ
eukprot:CAMPEP_0174368440 /NCGR_PEP_ID=MMETSP0811_2-20130205/89035_1 /TAXON_ID=73025 ORGANISM="Eutreptiella gymnastica-like, Strain CCMP1594" /NCGR_SAMPLE_ID=MMETSP0811_2 /ASSEMBLY_ACC=CAM_ASM_000667 /LENGTH=62 /DNA_ID=CAMNT_0015511929 /DNA_START=302 /DNA_END=490 /DNA_ORIENTATION=+